MRKNVVVLGIVTLLSASPDAGAQASTATPHPPQRTPEVGQVSKDSVWVPTPERMIRRLLQLADVTAGDTVLDLGSGDGRIPVYAAKHFGARAIGVELEENLIRVSDAAAHEQGVADRVRFIRQDLFEFDLTQATVIALYISPGVMTRLKPRLLALAPGTRVVSHQFTLDDWEPDEAIRTEGRSGYLWVVPSSIAGTWRVEVAGDALSLHVEQKYQQLTLRGERGGRPVPVLGARLRGTEIAFSSFDADGTSRRYHGHVTASGMQGESEREGSKRVRWRATRITTR